jgi:hypothetical protein
MMNGLNIDPALMARLQASLNQQPVTGTQQGPQGAIGQAQAQLPQGTIIPKQPVPTPQPMAPALAPPQVPQEGMQSGQPGQPQGGMTQMQQQILAKVAQLPPASQEKFKEAIMQVMQQKAGVR